MIKISVLLSLFYRWSIWVGLDHLYQFWMSCVSTPAVHSFGSIGASWMVEFENPRFMEGIIQSHPKLSCLGPESCKCLTPFWHPVTMPNVDYHTACDKEHVKKSEVRNIADNTRDNPVFRLKLWLLLWYYYPKCIIPIIVLG